METCSFSCSAYDDPMDGATWRGVFKAEDMPHALTTWQRGMLTAEPFTFEYRIKGQADGKFRWFLCKGKPCWNEQGQIKHWAATITDVEELVNARHEAVAVRNHIRAVLSSSRTIVLSVSTDLTVTFYEGSPHEAAVSPLVPDGSPRGLPLAEAWPDEELVQGVRRVLDEGLEKLTLQTSLVTGGKTHYYRYSLTPLLGRKKDEDGKRRVKGVSAIGANVTEVVQAEEQLKRAEVEKAKLVASEHAAKEASRLKTEYFTHISHETRTPVAGIISIAELLLSDPSLQDEHRLLVSQALRSGEILLELVGMVLDLRKVESGELRLERMPFTLTDVMEDAKLFSVIARKKVSMVLAR
jgi:signal transduction histidine kinase